MKIRAFQIETVTPKNDEEYHDFCDILELPSLKFGTASFIGKELEPINKGSLLKIRLTFSSRYFDRKEGIWRDGVTDSATGIFYQFKR